MQNEKPARKSQKTHLACAKVEKQNQKQKKKQTESNLQPIN